MDLLDGIKASEKRHYKMMVLLKCNSKNKIKHQRCDTFVERQLEVKKRTPEE